MYQSAESPRPRTHLVGIRGTKVLNERNPPEKQARAHISLASSKVYVAFHLFWARRWYPFFSTKLAGGNPVNGVRELDLEHIRGIIFLAVVFTMHGGRTEILHCASTGV